MHPMLNIAVRAARAAGTIIVRAYESQDDLKTEAKATMILSQKWTMRPKRQLLKKSNSLIQRTVSLVRNLDCLKAKMIVTSG